MDTSDWYKWFRQAIGELGGITVGGVTEVVIDVMEIMEFWNKLFDITLDACILDSGKFKVVRAYVCLYE